MALAGHVRQTSRGIAHLHITALGTELAEVRGMIWFFEKGQERLQYEIRRAFDTDDIEVVITRSDSVDQQRVESPSDLLRRSQAHWAELIASGWHPIHID
jgi:hypothetical protein